jgi:WD40 repeat protein
MDSLYVQYLGHWGGVFSVSISNKDDVVVTGGADCSVRLYDATSGNEVRRIDGHVEAVLRVSFSPSNKKIVSSSADMTAIIWDTVTGDQLTRLEGHDGEVLDAIFLTDMVVMTASNDSTLRTWKVDTGQMIRVFSGHKSAVTTCISMAKGTQAISSSFDKTIRIWEVDSGLELLMLAGHAGVIYGLDLSRDQRKLLSCASDQMVKVWDLDEGLEIETLHLHSYAVTSCAFDPTGCWIVTGGIDKTVRLFELNSTTDAVIIGEHTAAVCSIRFSNEGDFILSAGADGIVSKWEWAVAHQVATDSTPDHTSPICHVEFSSTGQHLISLSSDGVTILRVLDWQCCTLVAHQLTDEKDPATACKFAPNSLTVATLHAFGTLLWDTKTGNVVGRFAQQFDLYSLEFPDEVEYAIAPPMPPLVEPDGDMAGKSKTAELALEDPNAFNHAQMERLQFHARDRNKKRFRADYLAIAREINDLQGGREVDWRAAREELNRLIKDEDEKAAEKVKKQQEEARAANELKKHEELEELKRKSAFAKEHAAREAEKAIERLMGDFRFCENCGAPWVTSADSCSECSHPGPVNLSEGSCGSCIHCESEWIRAGNFCHRCGAERDRDAEDEARDLGIGNETDEAEAEENSVPANTSLKRSQPRAAISSLNWSKSEKKGAEGLFENGLHVWFDALKSIVSGTDSEVAIVRSLVQADKATLAQGKLNAEISVFGRELTAAEREAFEWNLEANVGSDRSKLVEAIQSGDAPNVAQPDENQKILKVADIAKDSPQPSGKKMSLFSSAAAKGALDSMKRSFSFKKKNDSPDVIKAKDSDNMDKKEAKEEALDSEQKQALLAESKRSDLKPAKAQAKNAPTSAASERKTLEMAKRALLHEMLRSDAEIAIFGSELEQNERDDAWKVLFFIFLFCN